MKEWYKNIPPEGIVCKVEYMNSDAETVRVIKRYDPHKYPDYPFIDDNRYGWAKARPLKPEECWKGDEEGAES